MAEAEDVIVDAARHVTSHALALWQRRRTSGGERSLPELSDLRSRLELLIEACTGRAVPVRNAMAEAPRTTLARLFRKPQRAKTRQTLPATDGTAVFLPVSFETGSPQEAIDFYRLTAVHQALRCLRGTAAVYPHDADWLIQDFFLVSELLAVDRLMQRAVPGWRATTQRYREGVLRARPSLTGQDEPRAAVEALYQSALAESAGIQPCELTSAATPEASLEWATEQAHRLADLPTRYSGLLPDCVLGRVLAPEPGATPLPFGQTDIEATDPPRSARMHRRPRARRSTPDEDDRSQGMWMVQSSPPSEHVEDPMGLQRPADLERDLDLAGTAESLAELEQAKLVSCAQPSREVLLSDQALPTRRAAPATRLAAEGLAIAYPEWDGQAYVPRAAWVHTSQAQEGSADWVAQTLERHRWLLQRVRRRFEVLKARRSVEHRQPDGDDIDLEALVASLADRRARRAREDRLYLAHRRARMDAALLVLIDVSGSTDAWVSAGMRIVDVEKEALLIVSTALQALAMDNAIYAFSGHGPANVRMRTVKRFDEPYSPVVQKRIAALEPDEYTRAGAAVRHACALLAKEPRARRLLLMLSDGKPNDCDRYEGRYGMEDFRQAIFESRLQGITPYCVTVDREAARHLPRVFGARQFSVVREPPQLAQALLEWLRCAALTQR